MSDDDDSGGKREKMRAWLAEGATLEGDQRAFGYALHTMNELGLWPDDVTVSWAQVRMVCRLVNRVQMGPDFPDELRM